MALPIYDNIPELGAEASAIARRRKIAEAMLAQGQEPLQTNQMAGQVVAPMSWTQGLAKMVNAYVGNKQLEDSDKAERGLANKRQQMVADALAKINQTAQGSAGVESIEAQPERTIQAPAPMQEGQVAPNYNTVPETVPAVAGRAAVPAVAPNKRQAIMEAVMSNLPEVQKYGGAMLSFDEMDTKNAQLDETREANLEQKRLDREAKMEGIKAQIESREAMGQQTNDLRAAMANLAAETRMDIASMNAANRGGATVKPTMVMGDDGKPIYVDASEAIGKRPYSAAQSAKDAAKVEQSGQAEISAQQVLDQADILFNHKGRKLGTGTSSFVGNVPFVASKAKDFQKNLDTFKAQTFVPMVSALKGMGALSDAEGKKLSESVGALDPNMTEKAFEDSIKLVTKTLHQKAKAAGLNVSLPDFAKDAKSENGIVEYVRDASGKLRPK